VSGEKLCQMHKPAPVMATPPEGIEIVELKAVPRTGRFNGVAMALCGMAKNLSAQHAAKVKLSKFPKKHLVAAVKYARNENLRIGLRVTGEHAWMWKMTPEEIAASDAKGERLRKALTGKKRKPAAASARA
jgi:hypothetical protein